MSNVNAMPPDFWSAENADENFIDEDDEGEVDDIGTLFDSEEEDNIVDFPPTMQYDDRHYIGRDEITRWVKHETNISFRVKKQCEYEVPSVKPAAVSALTPLDVWNLLIDEKILKYILTYTNCKIRLKSAYFDADHPYEIGETTMTEFKALLGLFYLVGIFRSKHQNVEDLWNNRGTGVDIFRLTMSYYRFTYLISFLSFDDWDLRPERRQSDTLAPVRNILEDFLTNCQNSYEPGEYLVVERKLEKFLGPCPLKRYLRKERERYGILYFRLVDPRTNYVQNLEISCKRWEEDKNEKAIAMKREIFDIVDRLVLPISRSFRNVAFDEKITSYNLMVNLMKKHALTSIGRMKKPEIQIPICFSTANLNYEKSWIFGFREELSLLSYVENGEHFLLYSTLHRTASMNVNGKPEMMAFYQNMKKNENEMKEIFAYYDVSRNTRRWPLAVFLTLLNIAGTNAQILYKMNTGDHLMKRRDYLEQLAHGLVREHLQNRKKNQHVPQEIKQKIGKYFGDPVEGLRKRRDVHGRCALCPRDRDRKSYYGCANCQRCICLEHAIFYCEECAGIRDEG